MRQVVFMRALTSLSTAVAACFVATACSAFGPACTLIGCSPSLSVELMGTPTGSFRIEAVAVGSDDRRVFDCPDAGNCLTTASFQDFTPEEVVVRVTTEAGTVEQTFRPSYETFRPNGPDCGPACRQARVRVPLPD